MMPVGIAFETGCCLYVEYESRWNRSHPCAYKDASSKSDCIFEVTRGNLFFARMGAAEAQANREGGSVHSKQHPG